MSSTQLHLNGRRSVSGVVAVQWINVVKTATIIDATSLEWAQVINATAFVLIVGIRYERRVGSVCMSDNMLICG